MLFNSKVFVVLLAVVLAVYYRLSDARKLDFLLAASIVFYGYGDPRLIGLVGLSIATGYVCALRSAAAPTDAGKRAWLAVSLGVNFGALAFFKYTGFAVRSVVFWAELAGFHLHAPELAILLPVGISFYTFQITSYSIDVYRGVLPAERNFRDLALYILFFPQLVAGPVERASHLLPQYKLPFRLTRDQVYRGVFLILLGYVKKTVLADRLAGWIAPQFADPVHTPAIAWASVVLFTTDIYVDFSAYADIAIGLGKLLGYDIRPNFDLAFVVPSIPERWRRWHISMSQWFRDYVYYPLGGSRRGELRTNVNILIVMLLSGLWHGASYNFLVWGLLNGLSMVGHRVLDRPILRPIAALTDRWAVTRQAWFYACCTVTFLMISSINIFFRSDSWDVARSYVRAMFLTSPLHIVRHPSLPSGYGAGFAFLAAVLVAHELERHLGIQERIVRHRVAWWAVCLAMLVIVLLWGIRGEKFIYYQF
jgi:alginate O-acetyltransferase complex protein AlgI